MIPCTIMVVWNNAQQFHMLTENLSGQEDVCYTLLSIDNQNNRYSSIREAFNDHIEKVQTEYVLFLHQDILFNHKHALCDFMEELERLGNFGVAGVAGCAKGQQWKILSNIQHGTPPFPAGEAIQNAVQIQSVDECIFAMQTATLRTLPFSDLPGWHLYAVEQCIRAESIGLSNYVVPAAIYHQSSGNSLDPSYITTLLTLKDMYPEANGLLNTTVKQWDLQSKAGIGYIRYYYWKQKFKKALKRIGFLKGH